MSAIPPESAGPSDGDIERRKLAAEALKTEREAEIIRPAFLLERRKAVWTSATVIVAIAGILATLWAQMAQLSRSQDDSARAEERHQDDLFNAVVKQFGDVSPQARLSAVTELASYWNVARYHVQVQSLLLASVRVEREPSIRGAIFDLVTPHADSSLVDALAEQNRRIQVQLSEILTIEPHRLSRLGVPFWILDSTPRTAVDSQVLFGFDDLRWNIETLWQAINKMHAVRNINFSDVEFALTDIRILYYKTDTDMLFSRRPILDVRPDTGLVFDHVRLDGASLAGLRFDHATFHHAVLNSVDLMTTIFERCTFDDSTTISGFAYYLEVPTRETLRAFGRGRLMGPGPTWDESTIDVAEFYPDTRWRVLGIGRQYSYQFLESSWTVRGGSDSLMLLIGLPRSGRHATASGELSFVMRK